ncbi:hypothetical protein Cs7R123_15370 [Catellatospora sp. TT07R-123]|uniref:SgcJ/EcaC family oxidoreductase n=1 Tax=Catellatospora sp. TT07R-123 TaxID=2733863 RepID=UPI001B0D0BB6|nr:SgcJ/EcaC family oxidoreductase [Catellatospora sp. TT07R-123]GHJ44195.1 hypothetical protein Cs7R123_15370 [Catellatospora sp. TT07R-123]
MSDGTTVITDADLAAVSKVPQRIIEAWAKNDADAFAAVFTEDGTLILPDDIFLKSRAEVHDFMAKAFAGPFKGTRVTGTPLAVKPLAANAVLVITRGGVLAPGDEDVTAERAIRASWLLAKKDGEWLITAYQNTPIRAV